MDSPQSRSPDSASLAAPVLGRFRAPGLALALMALTLVAIVASVPLSILDHQLLVSLIPAALSVAFAATGFVIARHQPRNPIGLILLTTGLLIVLCTFDASMYLDLDYRHHGGTWPAGWLALLISQFWAAPLLFGPLAILLFPDGALPSRRWRWVVRVYIAAGVLLQASQLIDGLDAVLSGTIHVDRHGNPIVHGPRILENPVLSAIGALLVTIVVSCLLAFVVVQVQSYRHATGVRRQQFKWVMCGAAVTALSIPLFISLGNSSLLFVRVVEILSIIGLAALPASIGVGILKYGLYEIDRLLSRTLSYAIVTGVLIALYFGLVSLATDALPISSPVGVAASTLAAAALFNPLRTRVQRQVDRRFNRGRYDGEATIAVFHADLRDAVDIDTIQALLLSTVTGALQPEHAAIWIREKERASLGAARR
jgi:hypothetical protein